MTPERYEDSYRLGNVRGPRWHAAMDNGGRYYRAFVFDPDGNNVEAVSTNLLRPETRP
jgi:hypothetical protein